MKEKTFAIYKGDDFIYLGTRKECAKYLGVKDKSITFYCTPTYKRRIKSEYNNRVIVIKVED